MQLVSVSYFEIFAVAFCQQKKSRSADRNSGEMAAGHVKNVKNRILSLTDIVYLQKLSTMSLVAELSEVKKEINELEKFSAELRGYL